MFDENLHFSPTMSMSVMSNAYTGPYSSPLLNKRRITRRVSTLRRGTSNVNTTPTHSDSPATHVGATTVHVRQSSSGSQGSEKKPAAQRSKSYPVDSADSGEDESSFERRASLKKKLFGGKKNKTPERSKASEKGSKSSEKGSRSSEKGSKSSEKGSSDTLTTESNDSLSSSKSMKHGQNDQTKTKRGKSAKGHDTPNGKEGKGSKRKTLMGRFCTTRPLSAVEVVDNTPKQNSHQRTRSDASVVKKNLDSGQTSPQTGIVLENSPSHSSYHTVVSVDYVPYLTA